MSADPVRDEAERLVAAAIAAVSMAARGLGGPGRPSFATGSPECCVCPVCRVISAMRDPSPELSDRLATGAGDLAAGVTSLLRAFNNRPAGESEPQPDEGDAFWAALRRQARGDDPWSAATSGHTATHADATYGEPDEFSPTPPPVRSSPKPMAKKAVAKKAAAKKAVPPQTAAKKTVAKKVEVPREAEAPRPVVKKVAKKAIKKAAPRAGGERET